MAKNLQVADIKIPLLKEMLEGSYILEDIGGVDPVYASL